MDDTKMEVLVRNKLEDTLLCKYGSIEFLCSIFRNGYHDPQKNLKIKPYQTRRMKPYEINFDYMIENDSDSLKIIQISGSNCVIIWINRYLIVIWSMHCLWTWNGYYGVVIKNLEIIDVMYSALSGFEVALPLVIKNKMMLNNWWIFKLKL